MTASPSGTARLPPAQKSFCKSISRSAEFGKIIFQHSQSIFPLMLAIVDLASPNSQGLESDKTCLLVGDNNHVYQIKKRMGQHIFLVEKWAPVNLVIFQRLHRLNLMLDDK